MSSLKSIYNSRLTFYDLWQHDDDSFEKPNVILTYREHKAQLKKSKFLLKIFAQLDKSVMINRNKI